MLTDKMLKNIERATVTIMRDEKEFGKGVLVAGNMIITAAHCVYFTNTGAMMQGDYFLERIQTHCGEIIGSIMIVEPVTDLCVIGEPDDQELYNEAITFQQFCNKTKPVPICKRKVVPFQKYPVYILNYGGAWVKGIAKHTFYKDAYRLNIIAEEQIIGGASGGPIVNENGELIGIVSSASIRKQGEICEAFAPIPFLALPVWIVKKIKYGNKTISAADLEILRNGTPE